MSRAAYNFYYPMIFSNTMARPNELGKDKIQWHYVSWLQIRFVGKLYDQI